MTPESKPAKVPASRAWVIAAIIFVLGFDLAFLWQRRAGATSSEFGGDPAEAAHYVTGLAVQHWLAHDFAGGPQRALTDFAKHYPIVRASAWPPLYPVTQAAWTSAFGKSRTSALMLMCLLATIVAVLLYFALREEFGDAAGIVAAAVFLSLPLVREQYSLVLPEMLCTAWMLAAALALGRFFERERWSDALWFGLFAALAILTDWAGLALVLVVPIAVFLSRKTGLLARLPFWSGMILACALAGPLAWYFRVTGWSLLSFDFSREALPFYAARLAVGIGFILFLFAVPSLIGKILRPAGRAGHWAVHAALLAGVVIFVILAPAELEPRRLLPALPTAMMFAAAGCAAVAKRLGRSAGFVLLIAGVLTIALLESVVVTWRAKKWSGFQPLAEIVLQAEDHRNTRVLVCSDRTGEGMFISEIALAETQPRRFIESAETLFANTKFSDEEELAKLIENRGFHYVVFDESNPGLDHSPRHDMLRQLLREGSDRFWEMSASPVIRDGIAQEASVRLYRVRNSY